MFTLSPPKEDYASTTDAVYVAPSLDTPLIPGQKFSNLTERNFAGETAAAMDILRPKYGDYYGFEASVPDQICMVRDTH